MSDCKENVLEIIDKALAANRRSGYCDCVYPDLTEDLCNHCKIEKGLEAARGCIVASVGRIDIMRNRWDAMQELIEKQLKGVMEV